MKHPRPAVATVQHMTVQPTRLFSHQSRHVSILRPQRRPCKDKKVACPLFSFFPLLIGVAYSLIDIAIISASHWEASPLSGWNPYLLHRGCIVLWRFSVVICLHGVGGAVFRSLGPTRAGLVALAGTLCVALSFWAHDAGSWIYRLMGLDAYRTWFTFLLSSGLLIAGTLALRRGIFRCTPCAQEINRGTVSRGMVMLLIYVVLVVGYGVFSRAWPSGASLTPVGATTGALISLAAKAGFYLGTLLLISGLAGTPKISTSTRDMPGRTPKRPSAWRSVYTALLLLTLAFATAATVYVVVQWAMQAPIFEAALKNLSSGQPIPWDEAMPIFCVLYGIPSICLYVLVSLTCLLVALVVGLQSFRKGDVNGCWRAGMFAILGGLHHAFLVGAPAIIAGIIALRRARRSLRTETHA